ncbi:MAG: hypothetical protein ACRD1G_12965, partial [Acidimicrobiales bacterium]
MDPASAALVLRLAQGIQRVAMLITGAVEPGAPGVLGPLWNDGHFRRVELEPLDRGAIRDALQHLLGGDIEQATVDRLTTTSSGNPYVLYELVELAQTGGLLDVRDGMWSWRGEWRPSPELRRLVEWRLRGVDREARRVAELASVTSPLGLVEVADVAGHQAVAAAEEAGLVTVERERSRLVVTVVDRGLSGLIRASMGQARRVETARTLARAFDQNPLRRSRDDLVSALLRLEGHQIHT